MPDVIVDRRAAPRYALVLAVEVIEVATKTKLNARTTDVSRVGCYIDTLNPISAGQVVSVRLQHGDNILELRGKVVYISPSLGMGVVFDEPIPPEKLELLDVWLSEAAAHPS